MKITHRILTLLGGSTLLFAMVLTLSSFQTKPDKMLHLSNDDYSKAWQEIDSLDNIGQPKTALEAVEKLYERAKTDKNPPQIIKTLIYRNRFYALLEEDGLPNAINRMREEAEKEDFPVQPILQSMLAEMYDSYLRNHIWEFRNRTTTVNFKPDDLKTWDIEKFIEQATTYYQLSISDERIKQVPLDNFAALLHNSAQSLYQPTLYDFLSHRALDYFLSEQPYLTQPAYQFIIDQPAFLGSIEDFIGSKVETKDSTSLKYKSVLLFQDLLRSHLNEEDPMVLLYINYKRINFVYSAGTMENKEELYRKNLEGIFKKYSNNQSSAEAGYLLALFFYEKGNDYNPKNNPDLKWHYKTAVELCDQVIQQHPNSTFATNCQNLKLQISQKSLSVEGELVNLPNRPILANLLYRNLSKTHFKIVRISAEEAHSIPRQTPKKNVEILTSKPVLQKWVHDLPNDGDYHHHQAAFKINALKTGVYALLVSDSPEFNESENGLAYWIFTVSNLAFAHQPDNGRNTFLLTDRTTGEPLQGVKGEVFVQKYNYKTYDYEYTPRGTYTSDANGLMQMENDHSERYFIVKFSKGDDILYLNDNYYSYKAPKTDDRTDYSTLFFLDRGIYRPGQTIYFKGLVLNKKRSEKVPSVVVNEKVKVTFFDANYQKIKELELTTNDYGTINGTFVAPQGGLLGTMRIQADIRGFSDQKNFQVEEYKRPKFEVTFEPVSGSYKLDEKVVVKGTATAYAGSSIDGAEVRYRVVRETRFPYWRWWVWGWSIPYSTGSTQVSEGLTMTDANGGFSIDFEAISDKNIPKERNPFFQFTVYADVTDITGETHSQSVSVDVSSIALQAEIDVPEQLKRSSRKAFTVSTKNLNGVFEPAQGKVKIERLETPSTVFRSLFWTRPEYSLLSEADFKKSFPDFPYENENLVENWKIAETVFQEDFDTEKSQEIGLEGIQKWTQGKYKVTLQTQDKFGNSIELVKYFTLYDAQPKAVPTNENFWFVTNKNSFEPDEVAQLTIGTAYKKIHVYYQLEQDGKILESRWLRVEDVQTIDIPIIDAYRGNIHYTLSFAKESRFYTHQGTINVPWSNKELKIEYATFRDKLQPGQDETWEFKISGSKGEKVAAEMLATMYDASLDAFVANRFSLNLYAHSSAKYGFSYDNDFKVSTSDFYTIAWHLPYISNDYFQTYPSLNWFNFSFYEYSYHARPTSRMASMALESDSSVGNEGAPVMYMKTENIDASSKLPPRPAPVAELIEEFVAQEDSLAMPVQQNFSEVQVRTNLNETVFFYPELRTDAEGKIILKFKMNEALTRWKFLALAHTQDLSTAISEKEVVTQKDLMVMPNPPRFLRENDEIVFTAKVSNLSENDLNGSAKLLLFDAITMEAIDVKLSNTNAEVSFEALKGQSAAVHWKLKIPDGGVSAVTYRVVAKAGNFSDGEEAVLPVLTNRMLLVETLPLNVRGKASKSFSFEAMKKANRSKTMKNHQITLEFTSNPAWYAVQSLPYLMEYPYECTEQIFSRYYANALSTSISNAHPRIKQVFESWKNLNPSALESNLSKNEELKYVLLQETPWVLQAQSEAQQKQNIGLLFDLNRMSNELDRALKKLEDRQLPNGGFAWFPEGRDSWYITQYIVEGMGHLKHLGVLDDRSGLQNNQKAGSLIENAVRYLDEQIVLYYQELKRLEGEGRLKMSDDHLSYLALHYLYARSFYLDLELNETTKPVFDYFAGQARQYWLNKGLYSEGLIALVLHRLDETEVPNLIVKSFKERSLNNDELGMYWKYPVGYWWYQAPIETHALMIEVFSEVANDPQSVDDLKTWLLKNRQTTHWKTTKATAAAIYAMLLRGDNWLLENQEVELFFGKDKFDQSGIQKEAGTGYFKTKLEAGEISAQMTEVKVVNPNKNPAWGAMYWQYFEDLDKVETFEATPLQLKKQLFKEIVTDRGLAMEPITEKISLQAGDKVKVRIELRVDRDMEYVHMKDARASGFEPLNVFSQYKWQGGLGYYESTGDAATNFFFDYLPKGTYVFEYPLRANLAGNFSNGVTTIQCMYAPEFTSHSEGIRVTIDKK